MLRSLFGLALGRTSLGRSRAWIALGVLSGVLRLVRKMTSNEEKVVFSERLAPGERVVITNVIPPRR